MKKKRESNSTSNKQNPRLNDYHKIRTPFVFLDETGSINDKSNRFFGLGIIKCMQPYYLDTQIRVLRQKYNIYDEIKWNTLSKMKEGFIQELIKLSLSTPGVKFSAIIVNKDEVDFSEEFGDNPYAAYQRFAEILIKTSITPLEVVTVLADYINTPNDIQFEIDLEHKINQDFDRLAIAGIHRIDSKGTNLLQMNDLYLGAVIYDFKLKNNLVSGDASKKEALGIIEKSLGIETFVDGVKTTNFKVIKYEKEGHYPNG